MHPSIRRLSKGNKELKVNRRDFIAGIVGTSFAFGFANQADASVLLPGMSLKKPSEVFEPTIWCAINPNNKVIINITKAEIGQHIGTPLAQILADDLGADWQQVEILHVDVLPEYAGKYMTGGSYSVWSSWDTYRRAGTAVRNLLIREGARLMGASPTACSVKKGFVIAAGNRISFGDIVARAKPKAHLTADDLEKIKLSAPKRELVGADIKALDIPPKLTGKAKYGIDSKLPNMVYARPKLPPTRYDCSVISVDDSAAKKVPGYERYVVLDDKTHNAPGWVVAIASNWPAAAKAAELLKVKWDVPKDALKINDQQIIDHAKTLADDKTTGSFVYNDAGVDDRIESYSSLSRSYTTSAVAHFTLEPMNTLAQRLPNGTWDIHTSIQCPDFFFDDLAKVLETPKEKIVIRNYMVGGGFGRRLNGDFVVAGALLSKRLDGRPVKMILTREDDIHYDSLRSPSYQKITAAFDHNAKQMTALDYAVVAGWPTKELLPGMMPKGLNKERYDLFALSGADCWYEVGAFRLRAICNDLYQDNFRPGYLRSVGAGWTAWALESFMDELAFELNVDPVDFRTSILIAEGRNVGSTPNSIGGAHRQAAVLKKVAQMANWPGKGLSENTALGIACTMGQERDMPTWTAACAKVHVNPETGKITCQKIWICVDAGVIVNPDGARAQVEGSVLWGISMALHEGINIKHGKAVEGNLNNYFPMRLRDAPEIEIEFLQNPEENPRGLGEPGVTPIAPAIANAVYRATGIRMRHLPMMPEDFRKLTAKKIN